MPLAASSSTTGFFQEVPALPPPFTSPRHSLDPSYQAFSDPRAVSDDVALARILHLYITPGETEPARTIHDLARRALDADVLAHSVDAEVNRPAVKPFNTFGKENKANPLWTTAGWNALKAIGQREGVVSVSYENSSVKYNRRVHQFGLTHVWVNASTMTGCPMAMTDGAAKLLTTHFDDPDGGQPGLQSVLRDAYGRFISRDPSEAWTTGQWMTERTGGSDVSQTESVARRLTSEELNEAKETGCDCDAHGLPLGPWIIDGFKWFSSATDSDTTLMLADTGKGLGLFFAPLRRATQNSGAKQDSFNSLGTELNGIRIQRLKDKIGTKSLPTAELELTGVRAWLIGEEGKGVKEISTILNLTRLHTAAASVGYWSRGLQVSRAYARVRKVQGGLLKDNPAHLRWMADNSVRYTAAMHLCFFGHAMLGAQEQDWDTIVGPTAAAPLIPKSRQELWTLFRLVTPVLKAQVTVASVAGLREHMEGLGGVGYCENNEDGGILNISRIYRDNLVGPIWEGTVSVMAEDVVRVITDRRVGNGKALHAIFAPWAQKLLATLKATFPQEVIIVNKRLETLIAIEEGCSKAELLFRGRELLEHLEAILCSILLMHDASIDGDEVASEIARRWVVSKVLSGSVPPRENKNWTDISQMDKKIFLGKAAGGQEIIMGRL
ncbi:putative acyl- dehydrogenase protein [Paramyrothecium foliicola]|nr:putative acyl- dehydrogenase protein [Paramyrothecium foliicola]